MGGISLADNQKAVYKQACAHPPDGFLGIHADFGQSRTLPMGPQEGGRWWYANARLSVNVLVFYVWGSNVAIPGYYTHLSDVLNHTPDYAIACLEDLSGRFSLHGVTDLALWADVGTHFRAARMWGYLLDYLPVKRKINTYANYFPDGHGKEKIDGHIGRTGRWMRQAANTKILSTHAGLQAALQRIADNHNEEHNGRSRCQYIHFNPPPVASLPGRKMSPTLLAANGCAVKSTFSVSYVLRKDGASVTLKKHTLTGLSAKASLAPRYDVGVAPKVPDDAADEDAPIADGEVGADGWRRTYRKHKPEKAPPAWKYMAQCFRTQRRREVALAPRRQPVDQRLAAKLASVKAEKARRQNARRNAAKRRAKLDVMKVSAVAAGSSGSSSSSESSMTGADSSDSSSCGHSDG